MSDLLPTNFVGTAAAAVQSATTGSCRVYFQNKDYQIYEMALSDPTSTTYSLGNLTSIPFPAGRINTPIAAVSWNNLSEIRVYYITADSQVQEIYYSGGNWGKPGPVLGAAVETSGFLYASVVVNTGPVVRVGFQSSTAPQTITEAVWNGGWNNRVL
ncbi:hypothetical protein DFJ58DRAFT_705243 [Suillus subalutaceus]|uniref:uncharacterized protein n=1 Tax=Suillus subalutaceus TaxID=48586 RepID=UPI001B8865D1|nr:uncharacterized protein DFJ58DRAFT_705243 [Suillus subalutaceus]KAG1847876.1 hypothetical protein DFJ58DRAFT_705243 [Suillus subalutaceus]